MFSKQVWYPSVELHQAKERAVLPLKIAGVRLIKLKPGDKLVAVERIVSAAGVLEEDSKAGSSEDVKSSQKRTRTKKKPKSKPKKKRGRKKPESR